MGWGERKGLHRREQPWQQHREGKENKFLSVLKWQKFFMQMLHEGGIDYSTQTHTGQIHFCSFLTYDPSPSYHSLCLYSSNSSPLFSSSSRLQPHYFFSGPNPIKSIQLQNFLATKLLNSALTYTRCCCYAFTSYCLQTMSAYLIWLLHQNQRLLMWDVSNLRATLWYLIVWMFKIRFKSLSVRQKCHHATVYPKQNSRAGTRQINDVHLCCWCSINHSKFVSSFL